MNERTTAMWNWLVIVGFIVSVVGCGGHPGVTPTNVAKSKSTIDDVCMITAKQMKVDHVRVNAETSLSDLGADELDFVELVMELEEHFRIDIRDETAERLLGTKDWKQGMKNVTMAKLAKTIDEQRQAPRAKSANPQWPGK